jgi:hypothetical protein
MTGGASTRSNYRGGPPLSQIGNRPVDEYLRTTRKAAAEKSAPSVDADPISSSDESDDDKSQLSLRDRGWAMERHLSSAYLVDMAIAQ